jgi:hypothetical protein
MKTKLFAPLVIAGAAAAAAIALAPAAGASNTLDCDSGTLSSVCQKTGHAAIVATPGNTSAGNNAYWPFGSGPVPPIWAMD